MTNEAAAISPDVESVAKEKITLNKTESRPTRNPSSRKVVGKKMGRKLRPARESSSKIASKDGLSLPDSKKLKRNLTTPTPTEADYNVCSSVPSVASTFSTEDSDLPDSIISPTDEETCSYVTDGEEESFVGDTISSCSDQESLSTPSVVPIISDAATPALRFPPFHSYPPCLNFCLHDEKVAELPWPIRRHLKWKLSSITPIVVRKTVVNSGFRVIKEPKDWIGTWGKHCKSVMFKHFLPHQKVNHFPGTFQMGRKDRMWRNMQKMVAKFGSEEFGFLPPTYILPHDLRLLRQAWSRNTFDVPWIIKPPASARGTGIQVIHKWSQLPRKRPLVVQSYVGNPYLINNTKFDIRLYVFVTSVNPLRIYLFEDGLVRFASLAYSSDMESLNDLYVHLTNYSINKNCEGYIANDEPNACQGHKWTLKSLWSFFQERGIDVDGIKASLNDIVIKTLLSVENVLLEMAKGNVANRYNCYELFGFDVLLDSNLKPWLLEVNISPSLHSNSSLDLSVKGPLIRDVFNMARFSMPCNMNIASKKHLADYIRTHFPEEVREKSTEADEGSQYCLDLSLFDSKLTEEEQKKHDAYENPTEGKALLDGGWIVEDNHRTTLKKDGAGELFAGVLADLTCDDIRLLVETEDEAAQAKGFIRIFPSEMSESYFRFMEKVRYYNILLNEWQKKFGNQLDRTSAINFLNAQLKKRSDEKAF